MTFVIGRRDGGLDAGPSGLIGHYRARDGSEGAPIHLDLDGPHAMSIVGKRGYGKSYTLGVVAEALARTWGVAPVVVDPMGVFSTLADGPADVHATVVDDPAIAPTALDPRSWCSLLDLSPESGPGGLLWQAAQRAASLAEMRRHIEEADARNVDKRAAINHVSLAESWDIFDQNGLAARDLCGGEVTVVDVSGLDAAPTNAVVRGVGEALYRGRVTEDVQRLPWLLIDEAHTFFDGVGAAALERILTRGRAPGVSLVLATQRPSAVSDVAISQSDVLLAHRLTAGEDLAALAAAQPTYLESSLDDRLPTGTGEALIVDDATETVHAATIRERATPHDGESPRARDVVLDDGTAPPR